MKLTAITLLVLVVVSIGCRSSHSERRVPALPAPTSELPGDPRVEARLETRGARTAASETGSTLHFDLRNKSTSSLEFAWAVEWFDSSGKLVAGSARSWTAMTLAAGETRSIQVAVPTPEATSWRLRAVKSS